MVPSVLGSVYQVSSSGSILKVAQRGIAGVSVKVPDLHSWRAGPKKGIGNELVDFLRFLLSAF